jgi:coenzyme PQQ precursor peptide PqqA
MRPDRHKQTLHRPERRRNLARCSRRADASASKENTMAWTTPALVEICIGLEINGYLPAEF